LLLPSKGFAVEQSSWYLPWMKVAKVELKKIMQHCGWPFAVDLSIQRIK
jgi:hypothetical protein